MSKIGPEERLRFFDPIDHFVTVTIEGKNYRVPRQLEILRCFQYLGFTIAYENFCWNGNCEHCATKIGPDEKSVKRGLCCQTPAEEGVVVKKLPKGIRKT